MCMGRLFHQRGKWGTVVETEHRVASGHFGALASVAVLVQARRCLRCNKVWTRVVGYGKLPQPMSVCAEAQLGGSEKGEVTNE